MTRVLVHSACKNKHFSKPWYKNILEGLTQQTKYMVNYYGASLSIPKKNVQITLDSV